MDHRLVGAVLILLVGAEPVKASTGDTSELQAIQQLITARDFRGAETRVRSYVTANATDGRGWYYLGVALHAQGRLDEALKYHLKAAEFAPVKHGALYNAACAYARKNEADQAFVTLQSAIDGGFRNFANLSRDPDLSGLRDDPRFRKLFPPVLSGGELFLEPVRILHTFEGEAANDQFGWVARRVGDIDRDGAIDFVTTAPTAGRGAGKVYVYSSRTGTLLFSRDGAPGEQLGNGAAAAGDVDADGLPDVIVGAPGGGSAYVLSGRGGELIWKLTSPRGARSFGYKVSGAGDLDADGHAEVAVTANELSRVPGRPSGTGACYIYSGSTGELLYGLHGERTGDQFGSAVAVTLEGDQKLLAVGAQDAGPNQRGRVFVYELGTESATLRFRIDGDQNSRDLGKMFVSFPGDFNGDDVPDVYASDFSDVTGAPGGGRVRVVSGTDGELLLSLTGTQQGEGFGTSPSEAGDVNDDGVPDLAIGAWQNGEGAASAGKVTLFSGRDGSVLRTLTCRQPQDTFGFDSVGLGDVNGDGVPDLLCTSAWSPLLGVRTGRVFVIAGER